MKRTHAFVAGEAILLVVLTVSFMVMAVRLSVAYPWSQMKHESLEEYQQRSQFQALYLRGLSRL